MTMKIFPEWKLKNKYKIMGKNGNTYKWGLLKKKPQFKVSNKYASFLCDC